MNVGGLYLLSEIYLPIRMSKNISRSEEPDDIITMAAADLHVLSELDR